MSKINKIPDFEKMTKQLKLDLIKYVKITGVNFFRDSFYNQGFTDRSFEAWPARKDDVDPTRKILIKSAFLLNSVQVFRANEKRIVFGSDAEYADIHNNGGKIKITITQRSRKYFWFMYKATGNSMWKALALTKKQSITVNIPKRQFIGESQTLMNKFDNWILKTIEQRFKQLK